MVNCWDLLRLGVLVGVDVTVLFNVASESALVDGWWLESAIKDGFVLGVVVDLGVSGVPEVDGADVLVDVSLFSVDSVIVYSVR